VPIGVVAAPLRSQHRSLSLLSRIGCKDSRGFEVVFNVDFPLPQINHIAMTTAQGAMENPGTRHIQRKLLIGSVRNSMTSLCQKVLHTINCSVLTTSSILRIAK